MIELVAPDPTWPAQFRAAADELRSIADPDWVIEHIGSTSIPGLPAKPIIDLAVRLGERSSLISHRAALAAAGWLAVRRQPHDHQVLVQDDDGRRTQIAHFFAASAWTTCHQRLFRDWLIAHPAERERYLAAKLEAVRAGAGYAQTKRSAVLEIVNRARVARGWAELTDLDGPTDR